MKNAAFNSIITICALFFLNCSRKSEDASTSSSEMAPAYEMAVADSAGGMYVPSSAGVEDNKDPSKKFIRTADIKFKVKDVIKSTYNIEDITTKNGGYVAYTNLTATIDYTSKTEVSADSSLESTFFTVSNTFSLRVPNYMLDSTLKLIAKNIEFMDYRIIKADNVALQILSNSLAQKRSKKSNENLRDAIDKKGKRLKDITETERTFDEKMQQSDDALLSNRALEDQVQMSTVNLYLYQSQSVKRELLANEKNIETYKPGFGTKIGQSIQNGWMIVESILVFLTNFWALIILGIGLYFAFQFYLTKIKNRGGQ